jgi:hypothetical protein
MRTTIAATILLGFVRCAIAWRFNDGGFGSVHRWAIKTGKLQRSSGLSIDRSDKLAVLSPDGQAPNLSSNSYETLKDLSNSWSVDVSFLVLDLVSTEFRFSLPIQQLFRN